MGHTMIEKILAAKADRPTVRPGEIVTVEPHRVMSHDNTAFIVDKFRRIGRARVWDADKVVVIFDHCVPAELPAHRQNHEEAETFAREQDLPHFFGAEAGVCHQVMMERGLALPGQIVLGADSHSTLYGAANAAGIPINRTEMAAVWATGTIWLKVPTTINVTLVGRLPAGVYAKDICLRLLRLLRAGGANYRALEFTGRGVHDLSMSSRMTLCNMAVELGAKVGIMPYDGVTASYLAGRSSAYVPVAPDHDASYEREVTVDLAGLAPQIACPHTVDNVADLTEVAGTRIHQGYLGSCTNGRLEDLHVAARILSGRRVAAGVRLVVYPASVQVLREAKADGTYDLLAAAGAEFRTASCGPCFGAVGATLGDGEVCISSSNRNFCGRMGSKRSLVYLSSPAVVAASCVAGAITDPRGYL